MTMRLLRPTPRRVAALAAVTLGLGSAAAYAASLSVGSWHLWAGTQTLTTGTCTLTGTTESTDTYVDQAHTGTSYGTTTTMLVQPGTQQWSFIRFDLSSCDIPTTGGADSATLSLYISSAASQNRTLTLTPVLKTWSNTLTWTQAQSLTYGSATTTFTTGTTSGVTVTPTVTVDVDALIKSSTANYGWRISDGGANQTGDQTTFSTSNATSNKPKLTITYEK
jgi:hypothetical protein